MSVTSTNYLSVGHQHSNYVTNILKLSPTSGRQHHDETNIIVTVGFQFKFTPGFVAESGSQGLTVRLKSLICQLNYNFLFFINYKL